MNRKSLITWVIYQVIAGAIITAVALTGGCDEEPGYLEEVVEEVRPAPYLIEYLPSEEAPEMIRIVGFEGRRSGNRFYHSEGNYYSYHLHGYGNCFREALQEVLQKYVIKQITPLDYWMYNGSPTKELLLIVEPRE